MTNIVDDLMQNIRNTIAILDDVFMTALFISCITSGLLELLDIFLIAITMEL